MEKLETIYRTHHETRGRYGYLYCHGARIPWLREWIGVGKRVLDVGCRDGMLTQGYAEGNSVLGVDIDRKALTLCAERVGIETKWLDLNGEWLWEEGSFDVVVACEVMEHLFFMDEFLGKVAKTLRKGGLFIGSVPNGFRMRNRLRFLMGKEYETDPTHVRRFSVDSLRQGLESHFTNMTIHPLEGKVLPFLKVSPSVPYKLQALFGKDLLWRSEKL